MKNLFRSFATGEDKPLIDDPQLVDKKYKQYRLSVMLTVTIGYGFAYTCRLALSVVKKPLIDAGIFSASELGIIGAALLYAYAFGKLTNGFLADHANVKRFFATGVLLSAIINLAMGRTELLWIWVILWGLNGWFQGFGAPTGAVTMANWFSNRERGRYYGIWSTGQNQGEALTFFGSATLVSIFGWQAGFWGPGIFCILVAVVIYYFLQDRPQTLGLPSVANWKNDHGLPVTDSDGKPLKTGKAQLYIFKLPTIWVLGLASATMYVTRYAINNWGMLYLQESYGYSDIKAGGLIGVASTVGIAGSVVYGFISDKLFNAKRPPVTLIFGLIEILALIIIFFEPSGQLIVLGIAFGVYGFTLNGLLAVLGGLFAIDIAPKRAAGAVMGFIGVFSYIGAATQDLISGFLIEQGKTIVNGVPHYDFSSAKIFWIGASVLSLVLAASLWRAKVRD
ncbi:MAG: MFS transporter [bacterium]|nr:MAG: MFS transporter [bacterium]